MIDNKKIDNAIESILPDLLVLRRTLHEHPELAFEEYETAKAVSNYLTDMGVKVKNGIGKTGVVCTIQGKNVGPTIGVRADIDALPIQEKSNISFASKNSGRMHACGHDVHTVIALGVAKVVHGFRDQLAGQVKFIFQPAEEILSGAPAMIADGVLENPSMDCILGYHNWPPLETGKVGYHPTVIMASSDAFDIIIKGKSAHAAHPHTGVDAILGASQLINQLQFIVSREIAPAIPVALTIGQIEGGTARNVIAGKVTLRGTVRTLDAGASEQVESAMRRILEGLATSLRLEYEINWIRQAPVLRNNPDILALVLKSARDILGADNVTQMAAPSMGSEDFAWFAEKIPAAHLRIGSAISGLTTQIHQDNYECNELAIPLAIRVLTRSVFDLIENFKNKAA